MRDKNQQSLKAKIENHFVIIVAVFSIASFGAKAAIEVSSNQDLVEKGFYTLNTKIAKSIKERYVEKQAYDAMISEHINLKDLVQKLAEKSNTELLAHINNLQAKKKAIEDGRGDIRSRNSPATVDLAHPDNPSPVSREEQDALRQIDDLKQEIMTLYGTIKS
jgi:hypothetical protein